MGTVRAYRLARARFERFPLTFEGGFMAIPPLVGLDLDAIWPRAVFVLVSFGGLINL